MKLSYDDEKDSKKETAEKNLLLFSKVNLKVIETIGYKVKSLLGSIICLGEAIETHHY